MNVEVFSQNDSSNESCASDCLCHVSKMTNETEEFEIRSLSSLHNINSESSDSSIILTKEIFHNVEIFNDTLPDIDNGHNEDTDYQSTTPNINLPPPACFPKCLQCLKENENPYFQFCYTCFRHRMEFFEKKPEPKRIKKLNLFLKKNVSSNIKETNYEKSDSEENKSNKDNGKNKDNLCIICFFNTRNGIINHGKIGHIVTCYSCAKHLWSTTNNCPICNVKIKCVTKMLVD
ncbi:E3 ubiquitin-protein ligase Mdm2-like [Aphis craccivora]|uniref:E3 ubiquitin-protein ligase Mdm2-like n=1 Tax=Aphis craccivora TaxID=307492 RepID=A0A6G0YKM8_APHCR|nr:E3 ubiquitin-protein ligase Mdm2-like [Aphis craccivora]